MLNNTSITVSWLIGTNVGGRLLFNSIDSCLSQTYQDIEVVVVVNGDETKSIKKSLNDRYGEDSRVKTLSSNLKYLTHSLNLGLERCRGRYIARLDSDDVAFANRLSLQVDFLERHPEYDFVAGKVLVCDPGVHVNANCFSSSDLVGYKELKLFINNHVAHPTVLYRTDIVRKLGGYMGFLFSEDYELWIRAILLGHRFALLDSKVCLYSSEGAEARRNRLAYFGASLYQLRAFLVSLDFRWLLGSVLSFVKGVIRGH